MCWGRRIFMSFEKEYKEKLRTAEEVAAMVESNQAIKIGYFNGKPNVLIKALAERHEELRNVNINAAVTVLPVPEVISYPESFNYIDWHWSLLTRMLYKHYDNITYAPLLYSMCVGFIERNEVHEGKEVRWNWQQVSPMDERGYFNFGPSCSESLVMAQTATLTCLEVNKNMPVCLGGNQESIHISQVDYIVEAPDDQEIMAAPEIPIPSETEVTMARHILEHIKDGSCLQLGIGGLPNAIGALLNESDFKDLGVHTEMLVDAFLDLIESGKANGSRKAINRFKAVYTFAIGTKRLYDFMHNNPALATHPVDYVNDPRVIGEHDDFVSINQAVQVDLVTQVSAESMGFNQISGNGGMIDFVLGAQWSNNGKSFICLPSSYTDKEGVLHSRIVPSFAPGTSVTVPRHLVDYIATEYGIRKMKAQNQWVRTENIIELAHPDFRDDLIKAASEARIWTRTNKIE